MADQKIIALAELAPLLAARKAQGLAVVLCHGCFDLMHPGHIKYLQAAKKMGDILVVTVTPDRFVDKGPGRPVFGEQLRVECLAALSCVDFAAVNLWPTAVETLKLLRPGIYVKGQEFENAPDRTGKLQQEMAVLREIGAVMRHTHEIVFSSTQLLNRHFLNQAD